MAIYHLSATIISGAKGASAVAAAAYQSGERLYCGLDGLTKDYDRKERVVYTEIFLPQFAPEKFRNRETLWNAAEAAAGVKGRYARRFVIALPRELTLSQNVAAVRAMAHKLTERGMCVDSAVHYDDHGNPHAHLMCTIRPLLLNGKFGQIEKSEVVKAMDPETGKLKAVCVGRDKHGRKRYKRARNKTTDWDKVETLKAIRQEWEDVENEALALAGCPERVDCRSYKDQGADKFATKHMGPKIAAMEKRGIKTEIGNYNRLAQEYNEGKLQLSPEEREKLNSAAAEIDTITKQLSDINAARIATKAAEGLLENLTKDKKTKEARLLKLKKELREEYYDSKDNCMIYGRLHLHNRPTGLIAKLSGSQEKFDKARRAALKEEERLEKEIKLTEHKIDDAQQGVQDAKRDLLWINPNIQTAKTQTQQRQSRQQQRTKGKQGGR